MLYRLVELAAATWGSVGKPLWDSLPPPFQAALILAIGALLIWRNGHNAAVWSDYRAGEERLRQQRNARLK